ncbi:HAD family hydrolase [Alteribacillus sp. HJP-4]|uniref:HAD family hydrolase n=1 Tax=Alteribacillus sp. HJP-4 TaxID=2775394 RepID=UPI0035CD241B
MKWSTICFDLDNTLYSHEKAFEKAVKQTFYSIYREKCSSDNVDISTWFSSFKHYCDSLWKEFENDQLTHREYRRKRFEKSMEDMELPYSDEDADRFHQHYESIVPAYIEPFEGLYDLLDLLYSNQVNLGIITNGNTSTQYEKIKRLQLYEYIPSEHIFISEECSAKKPEKEMFEYAIKKMHTKSKRALYIGDAWDLDIEGAHKAGWGAIYVNTRGEKILETPVREPILSCHSLEEVCTFFKAALGKDED